MPPAGEAMRIGTGRPKIIRTGKAGRPRKEFNYVNAMLKAKISLPQSYKEALHSQQATILKAAMISKYNSLVSNNTWTFCDLKKKTIGCRSVFTIKRDDEGNPDRYKARWQKFGVNYGETFSPVCRYETIRHVLALSLELKM